MEVLLQLLLASMAIVVVIMILAFICWIINSIFLMKFAKTMYYPHPALAWIPLPGFANMVFINSMNINFPISVSEKVVTIVCLCVNLTLLSAVPKIGFIFVIISSICGLAVFVFTIMQLYTCCQEIGASFVLCLLVLLLVPFIGMTIVTKIIRNAYEKNWAGEAYE